LDALAMDELLEVVALVEDLLGREASLDQLAEASPERPIQEHVSLAVRPCAGQTFGDTTGVAGEVNGRERHNGAGIWIVYHDAFLGLLKGTTFEP
jgi:hypothetical protein